MKWNWHPFKERSRFNWTIITTITIQTSAYIKVWLLTLCTHWQMNISTSIVNINLNNERKLAKWCETFPAWLVLQDVLFNVLFVRMICSINENKFNFLLRKIKIISLLRVIATKCPRITSFFNVITSFSSQNIRLFVLWDCVRNLADLAKLSTLINFKTSSL